MPGYLTVTAEEEKQSWYEINTDRDTIMLKIPCVDDHAEWFVFWINGEDVFTPVEEPEISEGNMIASYRLTYNQYGFATLIATDTLSGEMRSLTVLVSESGEIDSTEEGFMQKLPINEPVFITFSSVAGAWSTEITLNPDGTFTGIYHDSEMGEIGEEYPEGTVYVSEFTGKFDSFFKVANHMTGMLLEYVSIKDAGEETIENGIRFVTTQPAGLEGYRYTFCEPGTILDALPEDALVWMIDHPKDGNILNCYTLFDAEDSYTFYSYT